MAVLSLLVTSVAGVVALVALSAFFSSSESADGATPGDLRSEHRRLLVTILAGNTVVDVATSSILALLVSEIVSPGLTALVGGDQGIEANLLDE